MCTFLRLFQIEFCTSGNNLLLVMQIIGQHLLQIQYLGLEHAVLVGNNCEHVGTERVLHLSVFIQLIEHDIRIGILAQFDDKTHTLTIRFVTEFRDAVYLFLLVEIGYFFLETSLVNHVGEFGDHYPALAVTHILYVGHCAHADFATTCTICLLNAASAEYSRSCREIRSLDDRHEFVNRGFAVLLYAVVDHANNAVNHFAQVMRWDVRCHSDCDTGGSVDQQIRETGRQYRRLLLCLVKVRNKINSILIDIRQHFHGDFAETRLSISHGSSTVAVHRTEVSVSVNQRIMRVPFLR